MTDETPSTDRLCGALRSAREKLCVAQTDCTEAIHRRWLQNALNDIDRIGVFYCLHWSTHNEPSVEDA